jgi:uncharacterized membrane protein SirB2
VTDSSLERQQATPDGAVGHAPADEHPVVRYNPDAPSEEWGWHGSWRVFAPVGSRILLWAGVALIAVSIFSVHVSHVEDYWIEGIAFFGAIWLVHREVSGRKLRRRQRDSRDAEE